MATTKATNLGHRSDVTLKGTTTTVESNVVLSDTTTINNAGSDVGLKINSTSSGHIMQLQDSGTDVMVVKDGGDIGIGTSSPDLMGVNSNKALTLSAGASGDVSPYLEIQGSRTSNNARFGGIMGFHQGNRVAGMVFNRADNDAHGQIAFETEGGSGATVRMTINQDGKVGIGTNDPKSVLNISDSAGSTTFIVTDPTRNAAGEHWYLRNSQGNFYIGQATDSSGAWDSLQTRVTVADGGNVGIGTASPDAPLDIEASHSYNTDASNHANGLRLTNASTGNMSIEWWHSTGSGTEFASIVGQTDDASSGSYDDGNLVFRTKLDGTMSDKMIIQSDGKVGIGNSSPNELLCVGTSSGSNHIVVDSSVGGQCGLVFRDAGTTKWNITRNSNLGGYKIRFFDYSDNSEAVYLRAGSTDWTTTSDKRLKKDIVDVEPKLDALLKIKVRKFKWKHNDKETISFVAQELYEHCPEAVEVGNDEVWEEDNLDMEKKGDLKNPWGISPTRIIPMLVKSVQELSAKVTTLENA